MKNFLVLFFGVLSSIAVAQIPADGLVAHYPFNGNANDESGNGYNGEVYGATLTTDRFGNANSAYSFDGIISKILLPNFSVVGNSERSYFAWIKTNTVIGKSVLGIGGSSSNAGEFNLVVGYGPGSSNYPGKLGVMGGNFTTGGHDFYPSNGPSVNNNEWRFVGVTFDGNSQLKLFVDGDLVNTATMVYNTIELQNHIGYNNHDGSQWDGSIDDVLLYNRALSAQEILSLYQFQSTNSTPYSCSIVPSSSVLCQGESTQLTVSTNQVNSSNAWTQLGSLDVPMHAGAGAIYNGKVIVAAGGDQVSYQLSVRTFDLTTFQSATINSAIPQFVTEPGFGFYNEKLYVIGGYNGGPTNFNQSFDVNTSNWQLNATMPTSRSTLSSAQIDQFIYVLGGWPGEQLAFERYNVLTNTWEILPNIPTPRHSVNTAAAINGKVYFFAGKNAWLTTYFNKNEMYDPVTNVWVEKSPTPFANYGASACAHNGKIYILGGSTGTYQEAANSVNPYSNKLWIYTPETDSWEEGASFPKYIQLAQLLSDGNDLYCVGGICSDTPTGTKYTSSAIYKLGTSNTSQYAWSTNETTPTITVSPTQNTTYTCTVTQGNSTCTASVDIVVNPSITNTVSATIVEGQSYTLGTQTLTTAGTYTEVFTSAAGCDSTVTLTLAVEPLLTCNITAPSTTLCAGEPVTLSVNTTGGAGAFSQLPANLQQGLVAYYPFNGNANDESGNGNNGLVNGATLTEDRFGNPSSAYSFNGNAQYISTNAIQKSIGSKSYSAWVSLNDINQSGGGVVSIQSPDGQIFDAIVYNEWNSGWMFGSDFFNRSASSNFSENQTNSWIHLVFTYDNFNYNIYRNGQLIFANSQFEINQFGLDAMILIGLRHFSSQNGYISAKIDDVGIWEKELSVSEIQQLYTAQSYIWSTNQTTPTITGTPTANTSYSCTVTQGNQTCTASLDITVNPNVTNAISATIIEGETYTLGTQTLTTAGTYTEVFSSAAGCDSTVTLTLAVEPLLTCNITVPSTTLCEGESVTLSVNTTGGTGASSQLPANLQLGLVAYYPLDGVIQDLSNSAFGGQNFGAIPTSDRFDNGNGAFEFNGNGSFIELDDIDLTDNSSISFWVFPFLPAAGNNNWNYSASIIDKNTETVGNDSYGVYYNNLASDNLGFYAQVGYTGVTGNSIISGVDIPLNQWFHCVWSKEGNISKLFMNGYLIKEISNLNSMNSNDQPVLLGKAPWGGNFFSGKLDDLLFYNRALSPSEIQQLYTAQTYAWSNNETTPTITVSPTQTTTYTATVTTATQTCTDSITITVNPLLTWYADADADGFGNPDEVVQDCNQPQGYVSDNTDCNDEDDATYPGASEICDNNRDENCDGVDSLCFVAILGCTDVNACNFNPEATTEDNSCILPQPETCNGLDDNCNGQVDEGFSIPSINATSATPALYPTCTGNALKSANLLLGNDSPVIAGSGNDLWYSFTAQYNTLRVGLSAAFGDNSIGLYTNNNGCLELISEEHEVYTATTAATGNQILLTDQLTVGQTYYVAVHNISGSMNPSAKICFNHLTGSTCDHYYSNNTGIYTSVCNSFKAQYRANAVAYTFDILSALQNSVNQNITPWSYTTTSASTVVARLGTLLPANQGTSAMVYTLRVPVLYSLFDAAGNFENLFAQATTTCNVTLNAETTIALRSSDRCPTNKSLTSTIAPDRTVCGAMRYDWEFTEVLPNPGTAQVVQGGNYSTAFFLSNVPGITAGKTYSVKVRPVHSSGIAGQWGSAQCLRVGSAGMVNHPGSADADPPLLLLRTGGEMDASYAIYPNPTASGSFVLEYNGPRRGELTFAPGTPTESNFFPESMTELVMMDITGKVVFKTNVVLNGNIAEIHFGDLESGLYLIDFGGEKKRVQVVK